MSLSVRILLRPCLVATALATAWPACAEGNRLLPFWGQPYPYGYVWRSTPQAPRPCTVQARRSLGRDWARRCDVVLHARD